MPGVPVIDIRPLREAGPDADAAAEVGSAIDGACRDVGFFSVTGHGVPAEQTELLDHLAREFFARPEREKGEIAMARGGRAWRGWFPLGGELTSGVPDRKEGLYFGRDLPADDARVVAGRPLHGPNLYPARPVGLRAAVDQWLHTMTGLGHTIMRGVALGLGLDADWFSRELTADATILFRIFRYPPGDDSGWGVGEHTDYGLLTILMQDDRGGLQVRGPSGWLDVEPRPETFVCNIGDMLDRMTGGRYRSTPHRVRNTSGDERLSFPFFFDPGWDAVVQPLPLAGDAPADDAASRWDHASVHEWTGPYGTYLTRKIAKVFPDLAPAAGLETLAAEP
jgi:isopenicillin N synthase-like dioxygenase